MGFCTLHAGAADSMNAAEAGTDRSCSEIRNEVVQKLQRRGEDEKSHCCDQATCLISTQIKFVQSFSQLQSMGIATNGKRQLIFHYDVKRQGESQQRPRLRACRVCDQQYTSLVRAALLA